MELGQMISMFRKEKGMTIDQLAEKSGVPKGTLNKIIGGITKAPTLETVRAIAYALGKTLDDLAPETKKSPVPAEPEAEDDDDLEADLFYQALIADGRVREGEDITDAQLRVFADVLDIIDATFPKLTEVERGSTRETG